MSHYPEFGERVAALAEQRQTANLPAAAMAGGPSNGKISCEGDDVHEPMRCELRDDPPAVVVALVQYAYSLGGNTRAMSALTGIHHDRLADMLAQPRPEASVDE